MENISFNQGEIFRFSDVRGTGSTMHSHHYHDLYEIYYMVSGKCLYHIDDRTYEIREGDAVFIPEGVVHKTDYDDKEHKRLLIECSEHFIPEALKNERKTVHLCRSSSVTEEIHGLLKHIEKEYQAPDELTPEALKSLMTMLCLLLLRNKSTLELSESKNPMVEEIVAYIRSNYNSDISLSELAKSYFISPEHLSRTFKRERGVGFCEFLTLVRLQHAEQLLKSSSGKSISEIAYSCGFNDSNYFSDKFKRAYGISPLKYSKLNRQ